MRYPSFSNAIPLLIAAKGHEHASLARRPWNRRYQHDGETILGDVERRLQAVTRDRVRPWLADGVFLHCHSPRVTREIVSACATSAGTPREQIPHISPRVATPYRS